MNIGEWLPRFSRGSLEHRIAVITYRKNVKDQWKEIEFTPYDTCVLEQKINMLLCEHKTELGGHSFREIRRLSEGGHQTAIITTHPTLEIADIAGRMFGRWSQENFFRYLIADYDFDKMIEFGVETIDPKKQVVNPEYRKADHLLKKHREKINRIEAKFYPLAEQAMDTTLDALPELTVKQTEYKELLSTLKQEETQLMENRKQYPPKITLQEMPDKTRYNKLKTESKLLMNVIKMICFRAESSVSSLLAPHFNRAYNERRMLVKQIIRNNADLIPDYKQKTLTVVLHSLSAPRFNQAVGQITQLLNETETIFPGTDLRLIFKTTALSNCEG